MSSAYTLTKDDATAIARVIFLADQLAGDDSFKPWDELDAIIHIGTDAEIIGSISVGALTRVKEILSKLIISETNNVNLATFVPIAAPLRPFFEER